MDTLWEVERKAIADLDKKCDDLKIEWHHGGSELRGILIDFIMEAYRAGIDMAEQKHKQVDCEHEFNHDTTGGACSKCGQTTLQCSSD